MRPKTRVFTKQLITREWLVPHTEITEYHQDLPPDKIIIKPERIPFISYPYEWSFSQLKDAARLTLQIQKFALEKGLSLKDCSAYNIQFFRGRPILIDTLSFERYREGEPWAAYRQFCQHFLAPLALISYTDVRLNQSAAGVRRWLPPRPGQQTAPQEIQSQLRS